MAETVSATPRLPDDKIFEAQFKLAMGEMAECFRDFMFAMLLPSVEHRTSKIAGCVAGMDRALDRLRPKAPSAPEAPADEEAA